MFRSGTSVPMLGCRPSCSSSVSAGYVFQLADSPATPEGGFPLPILQMSTQRHGGLPEVTQPGSLQM